MEKNGKKEENTRGDEKTQSQTERREEEMGGGGGTWKWIKKEHETKSEWRAANAWLHRE